MSRFGSLRKFALREKFVLLVSVVIVASMIIISGYLIKRQNEIYRQELEKRAESLVANLAYNAEYGVILESESVLNDLLKGIIRAGDIVYVAIQSSDGRTLAEIGERRYTDAKEKTIPETSYRGNVKTIWKSFATKNGREFIELTYPVETIRQKISRENLGAVQGLIGEKDRYETEVIGMVRVGFSLGNLNREITKSQTAAILLTLMVVVTAIIIMTAFIRIISRPIETLVEITDQISKGDLSKSVDIVRNDEIGRLAESFNRMIESLKNYQDEIETYNRTLEEKIIERTRELEDAQAQLIQSEKMAAIGQLSAGVAHELNNPLGGILGYAQFALEKMESRDSKNITDKDIEAFKRYLRDIESQSRRCKGIVQNLLKFSRSSSQSMEFTETDINATIEDTLVFVEHQLMMNRITLKKNLYQTLPKIHGNAGQLQQVFTNIIINAMHASDPGSELCVETRYSPPLGEFSGAIEISFIDQGRGISRENLKKIFEPFFTTKDVGKGTGLGLSVSYGIIKEHGGEIKAESEAGKGTTFTIIIPVEKNPRHAEKTI